MKETDQILPVIPPVPPEVPQEVVWAAMEGFLVLPLQCKICGKDISQELDKAIPAIPELETLRKVIAILARIASLTSTVAIYCNECGKKLHPIAMREEKP